jgi:hypothetical protein
MKFLLANGCSHTAGSDIVPAGGFKLGQPWGDPTEAWPRWVGDHFGIANFNIAEAGIGNEQISRSTIMYVSELTELNQVDPKELMVCIMWSGFNRYEYWCPDQYQHKSTNLGMLEKSKPRWRRIGNHQPSTLVKEYIKLKSLIEDEYYCYYKNLYHMYNTAIFLESKGIEYYFSNGITDFISINEMRTHHNLKHLYADMLHIYGKNRISRHLGFFSSSGLTFEKYLKDKGIPPIPKHKHWGSDGQKEYAKLFIKHIEDNK